MLAKLIAAIAALAFSLAAHAADAKKVETITFTNKMVDGKKTWVPSSASVPAADKLEIKLVNELDEPHGFSIEGVSEPVVVKGKETQTLTVSTKDKKGAHKFVCGLHPAHVGGEVTVK